MDTKQQEQYKLQAGIMRTLAQPLRLVMLEYLKDGERCGCELCEQSDGMVILKKICGGFIVLGGLYLISTAAWAGGSGT